MQINLPIIYSQMAGDWAKKLLGNNTDPKYNFENWACLVSSFATLARYYGKDVNPLTLNDMLKQVGGFPQGSGEYINGKFHEVFPDIEERPVPTPGDLTDEQINEIKQSIDAGHPVIVGIDYNPKTIAFDSHFVIITGYDANDENNFTIADPLGGRVHSLKDYLSPSVPTARKSIWKYFLFKAALKDARVEKPVVTETLDAIPSPLPDNYGTIVKQSARFEELARKYFPSDAPENIEVSALIEKLEANPQIQIKEVIKEVPVEKIVEKVVESPGSQNKHWEDLSLYLEKDPHSTTFDDVKRVIAGYKSRETDFAGQAKKANELVATRDAEIKNLNDQISILKTEVTTQAKLHRSQIDTLKKATPSFDAITRQYEGIIEEGKKRFDTTFSELKDARVELAIKANEGSVVKPVYTQKTLSIPFSGILNGVKSWLQLKW